VQHKGQINTARENSLKSYMQASS